MDGSISDDSRNIKSLFFNHKDAIEKLRNAVVIRLTIEGHLALVEKCQLNAFKVLLRNIIQIGSSISNGKEFRDIFINLMERIVEPCVSFDWTTGELELFMFTLSKIFEEGADQSISHSAISKYSKSFSALCYVVAQAAIRLYQFCSSQSVFGF
jgi:hypothetical protein